MKKRTIGIFTGNRAEYGLQLPIIRAVDAHPALEYKLFVSGAHLDKDFGRTLDEIYADGFQVHEEIEIIMEDDSLVGTVQAIGSGISAMGRALARVKPDIMVVYADRFEGLAAITASTQMNIPTAHIEGGDLTEGGALDDSVRHAMTKLAHLHFTTNLQSSNRILGMGEEDWRVHTVGFPAIDLIEDNNYANPEYIVEKLGLDIDRPVVLFTQHSITTDFTAAQEQIVPSIAALRKLAEEGVQVIATYPNNDAGGKAIIAKLEKERGLGNIQVHKSLGRYLYHGILALAKDPDNRVACVGNSSSGIKETAAFGCPTVNIGSRQSGRLRGENVIDADYDSSEILEAINLCLSDDQFRAKCSSTDNPYYLGGAGKKIAEILATVPIDVSLVRKRMTLRGETRDGWFR